MDQFDIPAVVGDRPRVSFQGLVDHPRFAEARRLYLDRFLALYGEDPFLTRLLIETGRFLVFMLAVVLGAGHDPERRETWFTVGRLKRELGHFGLASDRQIDQLVARLREVGFLGVERAAQDGRVRILRPRARMLAHDRDWLAAHYVGLAHLSPHDDYDAVLNGDAAYQVAHRRAGLAFLPLSAKVLVAVPDMMLFFDRAAGHLVLAALLQAALAEPDQVHAAVPYGEVGDRFGVSRTHVRRLLETAEATGLVKLHARGGQRVEILPRLWASYDRGIAGGMYLHDMVHAVVVGRRADERAARRA